MATSPNFHVIESPTQFQDIMSADLNRVSLINFWAPWAEPCKQMNEVVLELAKKYPQVLVLQVRPATLSLCASCLTAPSRSKQRRRQTLQSRSRLRQYQHSSSSAYVTPFP